MRSIVVFVFACAVALASGSYFSKEVKFADNEFLFRQKSIFELLQHVNQREVFQKLYEESKLIRYDDLKSDYVDTEVLKEFIEIYKHGLLPMGDQFTIFDEQHRYQAVALFKVFYYAKDFATYYKVLKWARFHVNEGMFVYALTVSAIHRKDMVGIVLPAPYEIYPYYFFNSEVIQKAQHYKMQGFYGMKMVDDKYVVTIPANYTGQFVHTNLEQRLSYFTEDIGLNSYYYYLHADYPFWMGGEEYGLYKDRRGEFYMYMYQQILARYYLERLSNGLGKIPELSFYTPIKSGYYPALRYYNGDYFPSRENDYVVYQEENYEDVAMVEDWETRLRKAIDSGFILLEDGKYYDIMKPEAIEYIGNLIQSNPDSKNSRFYGKLEVLFREILSTSVNMVGENVVIPSVLEHYETAMRDPLFYQMYNRIWQLYYKFKEHITPYTYDELFYKGVKIEGVEVDKLVTFFDTFDADITNAIDVEYFDDKEAHSDLIKFGRLSQFHNHDVIIKARQQRLNHLPFTMKLHVQSEKVQKAIVKVFIGPKYDVHGHVYTLEENFQNYYELDHFYVDLVAGKNDIVRNSNDFSWFVKDRTTTYELYKQIMLATKGETKFPLDMSEAHCGIPTRLMLPKGQAGGLTFQMFFMVMPFNEPKVQRFSGYDHTISCGVGSGARYLDTLAFGYPFDREINRANWYTPNMHFYDVNIFHKKEVDINAAH